MTGRPVEKDDQGNEYNGPGRFSTPLWGSDPKCIHHIIYPVGGGIRCAKCGGWCCY